jgi:hypothetical protein
VTKTTKYYAARAIIAAASLLAACAPAIIESEPASLTSRNIAEIKSKAAYSLKDPGSAQFRNIRATIKTRETGTRFTLVCGEINGRNSFGGYAGFTTFAGYLTDGQFLLDGIANNDTEWLYQARCS